MALTSILKSPLVYVTFQRVVGGTHMRDLCVRTLAPKAGERILDIGCGPAYYVADLPAVDYLGFDTDERYIEHARARFGHRAKFFCEPFLDEQAARHGKFDGILLMGLLHHIDDAACDHLLGLLSGVLAPGGRIVSLDTTVHPKQSYFEHLLAVKDRGEFVRTPEAFEALAKPWFGKIQGSVNEKMWVPSVHYTMVLSEPRSPVNS